MYSQSQCNPYFPKVSMSKLRDSDDGYVGYPSRVPADPRPTGAARAGKIIRYLKFSKQTQYYRYQPYNPTQLSTACFIKINNISLNIPAWGGCHHPSPSYTWLGSFNKERGVWAFSGPCEISRSPVDSSSGAGDHFA